MRNLILSTLSTIALLIHPLSLSAQNSFSVSVDMDSAAGDQAVTSLNVSADQVITIQIFGKDIQNANGLAVRFEYDASQVAYEGFDVGDVLPNAQALPEQGSAFVEIGLASLGGQATVNSGLVGTIHFRATATFSGTAIRLVRAELSRGGRFETIMPNINIALQGAPTPATFSLSLDVNGSTGDQADTSVNVSADEVVAIQIFGQDIRNANGVSIRFEYDANQVAYEGFDAGDVLPNAQALPEQGTSFVEIGIVSFGGQATVNSGLVGTIRFRATAAFSGTAIRLVRAELGRGGQFESVTMDVRVVLQSAPDPDFDGDGMVGFADFLAFGSQFGSRQGDGQYEAKYDLDSDGVIGFSDFQIFSKGFGEQIPSSGGDSGGGGGREETQITIPDANLRAAIETALGKASGASISRAEMASLIRLEAPNSDISDLTGLAFATRLTSLDLSNNIIADVSALSGMSRLTSLDLSNNIIADVSALSGMSRLTSLALSNNIIADVSALSGMSRLTWLWLGKNFISNVSALANLTSLKTLNLEENSISDVPVLSGLTRLADLNLEKNLIADVSVLSDLTNLTGLGLSDNIITDITPISGLTSLESLNLDRNAISDLSPLSNLINLTDLGLGINAISDVSALANLTNLESLSLVANAIPDVSALRGLTNLTHLYLTNNTISDLTPLSNLTKLTNLQIWGNNISDVSPIGGLTNLESLYLHGNPVSDVSALSGLSNLRFIGLNGTVITDVSALVSALSGLPKLTGIFLGGNAISDISALSRMTNLRDLRLSSNAISDISALSGLTNLKWLYLDTNSISDIAPLVANTGLGSDDRVDLRNNPLSTTSINTHIPALQNRGVNVIFSASKPGVEEIERGMIPEEWEARTPVHLPMGGSRKPAP